jgi:hypothetical protein
MYYQRMLALPEHVFVPQGRLPFTDLETEALRLQGQPVDVNRSWEKVLARRLAGAKLSQPDPIPWVLDIDASAQYREPHENSKMVIASVAQRAFLEAPAREGATLESIKVYRVTLTLVTPAELARGVSPLERNKYYPIFLGEFDKNGKLLHPDDPFLYWYLPIVVVPRDYPKDAYHPVPGLPPDTPTVSVRTLTDKGRLLDCLEIHATTDFAGLKRGK